MKALKFYQHQQIPTEDGEIVSGDFVVDGILLLRLTDGYLNDVIDPETNEVLPAVELLPDSTHIEHWKNGVLHCEGEEPAIIDTIDCVREWWINGKRQEPPAMEEYERYEDESQE